MSGVPLEGYPEGSRRVWTSHELIKYYDYAFEYHIGKVNVIVDALSRWPESSLSHMR